MWKRKTGTSLRGRRLSGSKALSSVLRSKRMTSKVEAVNIGRSATLGGHPQGSRRSTLGYFLWPHACAS